MNHLDGCPAELKHVSVYLCVCVCVCVCEKGGGGDAGWEVDDKHRYQFP